MNAAIRAVVRAGASQAIEVVGVRRGFSGLHRGEMQLLGPRDVANTIQRGGTILLTARSRTWRSAEGRAEGGLHPLEHGDLAGRPQAVRAVAGYEDQPGREGRKAAEGIMDYLGV